MNFLNSEHSDKLFDFLLKTSNNTCQDNAAKIFESFNSLKASMANSLSNYENDALKQLKQIFIQYNIALPVSVSIESVFSAGKNILKPRFFFKVNCCYKASWHLLRSLQISCKLRLPPRRFNLLPTQ